MILGLKKKFDSIIELDEMADIAWVSSLNIPDTLVDVTVYMFLRICLIGMNCSFEPRSVVSGSARVRVCGVPRSVSRAAAVKPRASVPARSSGYPAVCTPSPHTVSAPRVRSSSFHTPMPIAILVISRVFTRVIGFSINCVSATACGPAAALWGRVSLSVTASGQTLLMMVNPFRIKFKQEFLKAPPSFPPVLCIHERYTAYVLRHPALFANDTASYFRRRHKKSTHLQLQRAIDELGRWFRIIVSLSQPQ
ncbi:hypothetical protein EVAR_50935_1 [Eumeta japonica]|uniref:Uncharacterized protein n=1 Tax=Eumeta variegata TaxID=151549 RepID=A0A4C1Y419_EUMVA|nr:hypothetical protein EVAR_50935_1 [Eumeta japonica]